MQAFERAAGLAGQRMYLSVAGGTATTFWAGVKLLDDAAEIWVGCTGVLWVSCVHKLVAMVIHFHLAVRTNHLSARLNHRSPPPSLNHSRDICSRP
jgi:hypothetical protein